MAKYFNKHVLYLAILLICAFSYTAVQAQTNGTVPPLTTISAPAEVEEGQNAVIVVNTYRDRIKLDFDLNPAPDPNNVDSSAAKDPNWIFEVHALSATPGPCFMDDQGSAMIVNCAAQTVTMTVSSSIGRRIWVKANEETQVEVYFKGPTPAPLAPAHFVSTDDNLITPATGTYLFRVDQAHEARIVDIDFDMPVPDFEFVKSPECVTTGQDVKCHVELDPDQSWSVTIRIDWFFPEQWKLQATATINGTIYDSSRNIQVISMDNTGPPYCPWNVTFLPLVNDD